MPVETNLIERLMQSVSPEPNSGCWLWMGYVTKGGYGRTKVASQITYAHRAVFEAIKGPIPEGLHLDHLCRVQCCVNPQHLEPVTQVENNWRKNLAVTHCPAGHPYDLENTYWLNGYRSCRACHRIRQFARNRLLRAALCR